MLASAHFCNRAITRAGFRYACPFVSVVAAMSDIVFLKTRARTRSSAIIEFAARAEAVLGGFDGPPGSGDD